MSKQRNKGQITFLNLEVMINPVFIDSRDRLNPRPSFSSGEDGDASSILKRIDAAGTRVVVLNQETGMSGAPPVALVEGLIERFPEHEAVGPFEIRWKL